MTAIPLHSIDSDKVLPQIKGLLEYIDDTTSEKDQLKEIEAWGYNQRCVEEESLGIEFDIEELAKTIYENEPKGLGKISSFEDVKSSYIKQAYAISKNNKVLKLRKI